MREDSYPLRHCGWAVHAQRLVALSTGAYVHMRIGAYWYGFDHSDHATAGRYRGVVIPRARLLVGHPKLVTHKPHVPAILVPLPNWSRLNDRCKMVGPPFAGLVLRWRH